MYCAKKPTGQEPTMSLTTPHVIGRPPRGLTDPRTGPPAPLLWQRTDTVGTELVFVSGPAARAATGSAIVAGPLPHTTSFTAELDGDWAVRSLTVTCSGGDWSRTLRLAREHDGGWVCRTEEAGGLGTSSAGRALPLPPPAGIHDAARLQGATVVRLQDSPIFLTWAMRHLRLVPGAKPSSARTVRVLTPSLAVLPATSTYHLVSAQRLRTTGDGPAVNYDLDHTGLVTYQPARLRLAR
jgi:hypothetical protein